MFKIIISLALLATLTTARPQCSRCAAGGSVRYQSQPQYETTVTRHESSPVYYYPSEQRYSNSPPSSQVVYQSQPSYQTQYYESQPVTYHTRRVISEPSYSSGTRYYTQSQPQVVYRDNYNTQGYSPCSGSGSSPSGVRSPCGGY